MVMDELQRGALEKGLMRKCGNWYWSDSSACFVESQWGKINGSWYHSSAGWYKDGSAWYYLRTAKNVPSGGPEGSMLVSGTWTIDGKAYRFDSSGACLNP